MTYMRQERGQIPHTPLQSFGNQGYFCLCVLCGYQVLTGWLCVPGELGQARLGKMIPPSTGDKTHGLALFHAVLHMLTLGRFSKGGSIRRVKRLSMERSEP